MLEYWSGIWQRREIGGVRGGNFLFFILLNENSRNDALKTCKAISWDIVGGKLRCTTSSILRRHFVIVNDNLKRCNMMILQRSSGPSSEARLRLTELVLLTPNCFSFGGSYFKQTNGVAMGTMGIEHQFCSQYHVPKPELYGRYIDDCIGATSSTREELTQFITTVNSFHSAL